MESYIKNEQLVIQFDSELGAKEVDDIRNEVVDLIERMHTRIVVFDVSAVTFIDSSGIGFVLGRYKQLAACNSVLVLYGIQPCIKKILKMMGIYQIITCIDSKEEVS